MQVSGSFTHAQSRNEVDVTNCSRRPRTARKMHNKWCQDLLRYPICRLTCCTGFVACTLQSVGMHNKTSSSLSLVVDHGEVGNTVCAVHHRICSALCFCSFQSMQMVASHSVIPTIDEAAKVWLIRCAPKAVTVLICAGFDLAFAMGYKKALQHFSDLYVPLLAAPGNYGWHQSTNVYACFVILSVRMFSLLDPFLESLYLTGGNRQLAGANTVQLQLSSNATRNTVSTNQCEPRRSYPCHMYRRIVSVDISNHVQNCDNNALYDST